MAKKTEKHEAATADPTNAPSPPPDRDTIARRAYDLYLARGCQDGHDVEDWLQAERECAGATNDTQEAP